jgi:hypothetical protein
VRFYAFGLSEIPIVRFPLALSTYFTPVQLVPAYLHPYFPGKLVVTWKLLFRRTDCASLLISPENYPCETGTADPQLRDIIA